MRKKKYSLSPDGNHLKVCSKPMLDGLETKVSTTARQEAVPGWDQDAVRNSGVFFVGAGGLSAEQIISVARKGYGRIGVTDMDHFEPSNYSRQFCYRENLYENKGLEVAKNLERECISETQIDGFNMPFSEILRCVRWSDYSVIVCNVDNNPTRVECSKFGRTFGLPVIFSGVSNDAGSGYVFIQELNGPCFGCAFPQKVDDETHPCPNTPATKDILKVLGGFVLFAIDSLLMDRKRTWNFRQVFLDGTIDDVSVEVSKRNDCKLCK